MADRMLKVRRQKSRPLESHVLYDFMKSWLHQLKSKDFAITTMMSDNMELVALAIINNGKSGPTQCGYDGVFQVALNIQAITENETVSARIIEVYEENIDLVPIPNDLLRSVLRTRLEQLKATSLLTTKDESTSEDHSSEEEKTKEEAVGLNIEAGSNKMNEGEDVTASFVDGNEAASVSEKPGEEDIVKILDLAGSIGFGTAEEAITPAELGAGSKGMQVQEEITVKNGDRNETASVSEEPGEENMVKILDLAESIGFGTAEEGITPAELGIGSKGMKAQKEITVKKGEGNESATVSAEAGLTNYSLDLAESIGFGTVEKEVAPAEIEAETHEVGMGKGIAAKEDTDGGHATAGVKESTALLCSLYVLH
jgi:hypothetical protein